MSKNIYIFLFLIIILIAILFLFIFINKVPKVLNSSNKQLVISKCVSLCNLKLNNNVDLSSGPCLSNNILNDWVCDIAHNPRKIIDNNKDNECSDYLNHSKHHFVELTPDCKLIRVI